MLPQADMDLAHEPFSPPGAQCYAVHCVSRIHVLDAILQLGTTPCCRDDTAEYSTRSRLSKPERAASMFSARWYRQCRRLLSGTSLCCFYHCLMVIRNTSRRSRLGRPLMLKNTRAVCVGLRRHAASNVSALLLSVDKGAPLS